MESKFRNGDLLTDSRGSCEGRGCRGVRRKSPNEVAVDLLSDSRGGCEGRGVSAENLRMGGRSFKISPAATPYSLTGSRRHHT